MKQHQMSAKNRVGWNHSVYKAWEARHGTPKQFAKKLVENPEKPVQYYLNEIGDVKGKRLLNLLGSKGNKAVCFALLGAEVTVVDISSENQRYATELAKEAGVSISYIVSDVMELKEEQFSSFDVIVLEMGVLHYFLELHPLFLKIFKLMNDTSVCIVREYHPFVSKAMTFENGIVAIEGNYFSEKNIEVDVAYAQLLPEEEQMSLEKNVIRRWSLSEVINALVETGLTIRKVAEDKGIRWAFPNEAPIGIEEKIPGTYSIISIKK
jgi:SAM-dependent methyltransferase